MEKRQKLMDGYADRAIKALEKPLNPGGEATQLYIQMVQEKRNEADPFYHHVFALLKYAKFMRSNAMTNQQEGG